MEIQEFDKKEEGITYPTELVDVKNHMLYERVDPYNNLFPDNSINNVFLLRVFVKVTDITHNENIKYRDFMKPDETYYKSVSNVLVKYLGYRKWGQKYVFKFSYEGKTSDKEMFDLNRVSDVGPSPPLNTNEFEIIQGDFAYGEHKPKSYMQGIYTAYCLLYKPVRSYNVQGVRKTSVEEELKLNSRYGSDIAKTIMGYVPSRVTGRLKTNPKKTGGKRKRQTRKRRC